MIETAHTGNVCPDVVDLASQKHRGLSHWKNFLDKKAKAARKAADLAEAQKALGQVANPIPQKEHNDV
jgi:hypothetical protein